MDYKQDVIHALDCPTWCREKLRFNPDPWQERLMKTRSRRVILCCSRQVGKSTCVGIIALHRAIYRPGALVLVVAPSIRQAGELYRKIQEMARIVGVNLTEDTKTTATLKNGSRILALPGTEQTIVGFSAVDSLIIDEAARADNELVYATRPMLAVSKGSLFMLSTPYGRRGAFFEAWNSDDPQWERISITATECPRIDPAFLEEERRALGPVWFGQEYLCQFADVAGAVFSHNAVMAALGDVKPLFL